MFEPEDFDSWPSDKAKAEVMSTIAEILRQGYRGVVVETHQLSDGRTLGKYFTDQNSPEGRVVAELLAQARLGNSWPTAEIISKIENAHYINGLALPTKRGGVK
jgi:hypothetical protein